MIVNLTLAVTLIARAHLVMNHHLPQIAHHHPLNTRIAAVTATMKITRNVTTAMIKNTAMTTIKNTAMTMIKSITMMMIKSTAMTMI